MSIHYLDNAATTRVDDRALEAAVSAMREVYGNPSSVHSMGVDAENMLRSCRDDIASALGAASKTIVFTSGGTEANNLAIAQVMAAHKRLGRHVITTALEHSSVLEPVKWLEHNGFEVDYLQPDKQGVVSLDRLEDMIRPDTAMLSMMLICNETGVRLPVEDAAAIFKRKRPDGLVHCDAVQGFCKERFLPAKVSVDLLSVSSHKVHGPKGAGALYTGGVKIVPTQRGGGHENGVRAGTQAMPAIAGFAAAVRECMLHFERNNDTVSALRERLVDGLRDINGVTVLTVGTAIATLAVPRYPSEVIIRLLEQRGVMVSSGSACGRGKPSHALSAMKLDSKLLGSAVRVSWSHTNTAHDVDALLAAVSEIA